MKHSDEEIEAFIWLHQQFYKVGLLTAEQIAELESIDGWTWDDGGSTPPATKTRRRVMQEIRNGYLRLDRFTPAQVQSFESIFRNGIV